MTATGARALNAMCLTVNWLHALCRKGDAKRSGKRLVTDLAKLHLIGPHPAAGFEKTIQLGQQLFQKGTPGGIALQALLDKCGQPRRDARPVTANRRGL